MSGRPAGAGLWAFVVTGGRVDDSVWRRASANSEIVGVCRECGGYVMPADPPDYGEKTAIRFYVARCGECGREIVAPGGRVLRGSARLTERSAG